MKVIPHPSGENIGTKQDQEVELIISSIGDPSRSFRRDQSNSSFFPVKLSKAKFFSKIYQFFNSKSFTIFISIVTLYALFGDDIRMAFFTKSQDNIFFSLATFSMFVFLCELLVFTFLKPSYRWTFYFWLDLLATVSLIPDIGWLWDVIIGIDPTTSNGRTKNLQNAAKASRIGTRTSRVVRIIRLIRLIRMVKLYKNAKILKGDEKFDSEKDEAFYEEDHSGNESKVGTSLSNLITQKVIIMILLMLMIFPIFDSTFYVDAYSWTYEVGAIGEFIEMDDFPIMQ
jgi:hypothetical protein